MSGTRALWFVLDMDDGVRGVFRTKQEAVASRVDRAGHVVRRWRYGPGSYEYHWHYKGNPDDGDGFFLERGTPDNIKRGGWDWAYDAWVKAGSPVEPFLTIEREDKHEPE